MSEGLLTVEASKVVKELRDELNSLSSRIAVIREELAHWEKAIELHDQRHGHKAITREKIPSIDFSRFTKLSELETVLRVAEEHNGDIEMKLVTRIFEGKVKNRKNAGPAAYTIVRRLVKQGRAIWVKKGLYHLTNSQPKATE
jgi:hypothetical protein